MAKKVFVCSVLCLAFVSALVSCGGGDAAESSVQGVQESVAEVLGYDFVYRIVPDGDEAFDDSALEVLFNILVARLDFLGYDGSTVSLYTSGGSEEHFVRVEVPYNCDKDSVNRSISRKGLFEVRDCDGNVILDSSDVEDSYPSLITTEEGELEFAANVFYNEEGAVKLGQATERISAYEEGRDYLDFYFDGVQICRLDCDAIISTGESVVTRADITEEEVLELSENLKLGMLNYELVLDSAEKRS